MASYLMNLTFQNRGYDHAFLNQLETGSASAMLDRDALCDALFTLHEQQKRVVLITDFDMDGICCGVLGACALQELGFVWSLWPTRPADGYGFTADTVESLLCAFPDTAAILTSDLGVQCFDGIQTAKDHGVSVYVTDHHKDRANGTLPAADLVVDPMRHGDPYEHPAICGAHVLWQVFDRYAKLHASTFAQEQIRRLRLFAGIGTVSDGMPFLHENRELIRDAVRIARLMFFDNHSFLVDRMLGSVLYRNCFLAVHQLLSYFASDGKILENKDINADFFAFYLAPMFNSVKRMNGDINRAFAVFFNGGQRDDIAYLYELNQRRKELVAYHLDEMSQVDQPYAPFIYESPAPAGILGLLAQHKCAETGMPVIVVNPEDSYKGSGRSPAWYPFLTRAGSHVTAAGHESAFGAFLGSESRMKEAADFLKQDVPSVMPEPSEQKRIYDFVIDVSGRSGEVGLDPVAFLEYLDDLRDYEPFGSGFPKPHLLLRIPKGMGVYSRIGSARTHLKIQLPLGVSVLLWNQADMLEEYRDRDELLIEGVMSLSWFQDNPSLSFTGEVCEP